VITEATSSDQQHLLVGLFYRRCNSWLKVQLAYPVTH